MGEPVQIPNGFWVYLKELPFDTKEEEIVQHFNRSGLGVSLEDVSPVRLNRELGATAIVSIPKSEQFALIKWALCLEPFRGDRFLTAANFGTLQSKRRF